MADKKHSKEQLEKKKAEFEEEFEKIKPFLRRKRLKRITTADKWGFSRPLTEKSGQNQNKYYTTD